LSAVDAPRKPFSSRKGDLPQMKARLLVAAVALAVCAPFTAHAVDLPVSYTVEEKPLKDAISGTVLTFSLYSDAACTSLVVAMPENIEDVTLLSRLKLFTPKNATKLPKTVEMRTTLNVSVSGAVYLKVTGAGIAPVGGACQAQATAGGTQTTAL